jgi:hypothetical protein
MRVTRGVAWEHVGDPDGSGARRNLGYRQEVHP